jgi:hypothetical protein
VIDSGTIGLQFECGDPFIYEYLLKQKNFNFSDGIRFVSGSIVPDPIRAGDIATVDVDVLTSQQYRVAIVDASGKEVSHESMDLSYGVQTIAVSTSSLRSGTYHLIISDEAGRPIVTQFVVSR